MSDMQDMTEAAPEPGADIDGFSVKPGNMMNRAGGADQQYVVTFGKRTLEVRELPLSAQWDLLEIAAGAPSEGAWFNLATVAASVTTIDGVPAFVIGGTPDKMKRDIRARLDKLGQDGLRAASAGLAHIIRDKAGPQSQAEFVQQVGN